MDNKKRKRCFVAITGTSGAGKTTVLNFLKDEKYAVFDTDRFSREIIKKEPVVAMYLKKIIGEKACDKNELNLKKIGDFFENNPDLENEFENWYQKILGKKIIEIIDSLNDDIIYFFDVPFLDKKEICEYFNEIWIIESDFSMCFERVKKRNNYPDSKIHFLINRSIVDTERITTNYKIIKNNNSIEMLKKVVADEIKKLDLEGE